MAKGKKGKPPRYKLDDKGNRIPNPKNPKEWELISGGYGGPLKRKPAKKAAKAEKSNAPNAEKLLASVMNAAGNKNAVALAALSAKDLNAAKVIIGNAELAAKVFGMKAVSKDVKAAEILKANKKLAAILTGKTKK